jgi:multidrug efflux pump subunit AcrB
MTTLAMVFGMMPLALALVKTPPSAPPWRMS